MLSLLPVILADDSFCVVGVVAVVVVVFVVFVRVLTGTPLFSFIIFTALIMRPITGVLIAAYDGMVRCINRLENWETLKQ